jgi:hypothetical protein
MKKHVVGLVALVLAVMVFVGCGPKADKKQAAPKKPAAPTMALNHLDPDKVSDDYDVGFLMKWQILGPFSFEKKPYKKEEEGCTEAIDDPFVENEAALGTQEQACGCGGKKWMAYDAEDAAGLVDLDAMCDGLDYAAAYMVANVKSPKALKGCQLLLGSDDYIRVWVNGKVVYTYTDALRGATPDEDTVKGVDLKEGWNTILIKCVDVYGGWGVYCRIANDKGKVYEIK